MVKMDLQTRVQVFEKDILRNPKLSFATKFRCMDYLFRLACIKGEIEIAMAIDEIWAKYTKLEVIEDEA